MGMFTRDLLIVVYATIVLSGLARVDPGRVCRMDQAAD